MKYQSEGWLLSFKRYSSRSNAYFDLDTDEKESVLSSSSDILWSTYWGFNGGGLIVVSEEEEGSLAILIAKF